jgi:DUF1365 family protein
MTVAGALIAVLAEVNNTFGGRITTICWCPPMATIFAMARRWWPERFFMSRRSWLSRASIGSDFLGGRDGTRNLARIEHADDAGDLLHTAVSGGAAPLAARTLLRALFAYPWQSVGVIARIHWQALRLWLKRVPFFSKPVPPLEETTR